jgi:hypothetical protein
MDVFNKSKSRPTPKEAEMAALSFYMRHVLKEKYFKNLTPKDSNIFDFTFRSRTSGVYLIGDFYVGKSKDIGTRLYDHHHSVRCQCSNAVGKGAIDFYERHGLVNIPVILLSHYPKDEMDIMGVAIDAGYPLSNVYYPKSQ